MAEMVSVYPMAAEKAGVTGMAVIGCRVGKNGRLRSCSIRKQDPAQYGFGEAGLKLTAHFRMEAKDADGRPTAGAPISIPIKFAISSKDTGQR